MLIGQVVLIMECLLALIVITQTPDKIDSPTEYINAVTKLLPYSIGKVKAYEEIEEREPISININFVDTEAEEED